MKHETSKKSQHMISRARDLRDKAFIPERLLWGRLRDRRCAGLKFRRQQPVGPYVADFFCPEAWLVIELDGRSHDEQGDQDSKRQSFLEEQGLTVIRFTNDQVLKDLDGVVEGIAVACETAQGRARGESAKLGTRGRGPVPSPVSPSASHPLPQGERGS